jgi:hypothetical protein
MTSYRVDDEGYRVRQEIAWKPTLKIFARAIGFGIAAGIAAWISPILIFTMIIEELVSEQMAWIFSGLVAILTTAFYLTFKAGRRQLIVRRDGRRLRKHLPEVETERQIRDYWAEYYFSVRNLGRTLEAHRGLVEEMKAAGFDPKDRPKPTVGRVRLSP